MSHSNIFKVKELRKDFVALSSEAYEPISVRTYLENGFLEKCDYVKPLNPDMEASAYEEFFDAYASVFKETNPLEKSQYVYFLVSLRDLKTYLKAYKNKLSKMIDNAFSEDETISLDKIKDAINPTRGFYIEYEDECYNMIDFLINIYNSMVDSQQSMMYFVFEGALDYHC